ncbi:MAG: 16S rRNA (cytosine(1402)-N(4))-methyltransferase [Parcubacteria group bacterium CG2_30_36_18]|nr:MAG: 16S rRNA (cytosine(1402)-N(4))-methyltransferase [Parcubacteria group bacterium CG2_30_36_18]
MVTHIPVLQKEVLEYFDQKPNENFIDCTIGEGGHTLAILEKNGPKGKVLGIEWDPELYKKLSRSDLDRLKARLILVNDNFANLEEIAKSQKFRSVSGILFDLGMSSWHLEESGRGFSFQKKEPLDMRYNPQNPLTAEKIVNYWSALEIEKILEIHGEERFSKQIAKYIISFREVKPIKTTSQLVEIIKKATPDWYHRRKIHPATKTFQALRIAVNDELNNLEKALPKALNILKPGGRIVAISFQSLEDRIIKNFLKEKAKENILKILTKKPIKPSLEEIKINPRSRSAKLRAAEKL